MKTKPKAKTKQPAKTKTGNTQARETGKAARQGAAAPKRVPRSRGAVQKAAAAAPATPAKTAPRPTSKKAMIEGLVRRPQGSAIAELVAATGWQEHSVRAALTGLRKTGCTIARDHDGGATRYRIVGAV